MSGRRAAELIVKCRIERLGVAFDGKAWAVVVLADMHGDELLGAIGDEFARRVGGLIVGEMAFCGQDSLLEEAGVISLAQHGHIVVALERKNSAVFKRVDGMA